VCAAVGRVCFSSPVVATRHGRVTRDFTNRLNNITLQLQIHRAYLRRMQRSEKQIAKSKGVTTPAGRRISSRNDKRLTLLARAVLFEGESRSGFPDLVASYGLNFNLPQPSEKDFVERMDVAPTALLNSPRMRAMPAIRDTAGNSAGETVPATLSHNAYSSRTVEIENSQTNLDFDKPHRIRLLQGNWERGERTRNAISQALGPSVPFLSAFIGVHLRPSALDETPFHPVASELH
jgi:hypothetical protein